MKKVNDENVVPEEITNVQEIFRTTLDSYYSNDLKNLSFLDFKDKKFQAGVSIVNNGIGFLRKNNVEKSVIEFLEKKITDLVKEYNTINSEKKRFLFLNRVLTKIDFLVSEVLSELYSLNLITNHELKKVIPSMLGNDMIGYRIEAEGKEEEDED